MGLDGYVLNIAIFSSKKSINENVYVSSNSYTETVVYYVGDVAIN